MFQRMMHADWVTFTLFVLHIAFVQEAACLRACLLCGFMLEQTLHFLKQRLCEFVLVYHIINVIIML